MSAIIAEPKLQVNFDDNLTNDLKESLRAGADYLDSVTNMTLESLDAKMKLSAVSEPAHSPDGEVLKGRKGVRLQLELIQPIQSVSVNAWLSEQNVADPIRRDIEFLRLSRAVLRHWSDVHLQRFDAAMDELIAKETEAIPNA